MNHCVYILLCRNNRFYVGSASDLVRRLKEHVFGYERATRNLRPPMLVFHQAFPTLRTARGKEKWLKKQKSRKAVLTVVNNGF